jgi:RNA polymerase sigma-70 factor (ECF subfamily)
VLGFTGQETATRLDFEERTLPYLDSLHGFAAVLTGRSEDAHDLVQAAYVQAYCEFRRGQSVNDKVWLFALTKRLFVDRYHQRAREIALTEIEVDVDDPYESPKALLPAARDRHEAGVFRQDFLWAMATLPETLRLTVLLKDVEGFEYRAIAQIMGCPLGTVLSRLSRGRNLLKRSLKACWLSGSVSQASDRVRKDR